jgi:carbon-monoxide dehydrogenase large subunit
MEPGLDFAEYYNPPDLSTAPDDKGRVNVVGACANAAHVAVVEVDPETWEVKILRYVACHDSGVVINPAIVEGQVIGGVAQSVGGTLYEFLEYDENGQLLNGTFMDYLLPSAMEVPHIMVGHLATPSLSIPRGFKGAGESGTISAPAALVNAIESAISQIRPTIRINSTLATPDSLWRKWTTVRRN